MPWLWVALVVFSVDQSTKNMVSSQMVVGETIPLWAGIMHITYVQNPGAAFGILANRTGFFVVMSIIVVGAIIYASRHFAQNRTLIVALALQLGGALGNLADRLRMGYVVDFFDLRVWPVFNVADVAIVTGVCLLALELFRRETEKEKATRVE